MKFTKLILKKGKKEFTVDTDDLTYDIDTYERNMGTETLYRATGYHPETGEEFTIEFTEYPIYALDSGPFITECDFEIVDYDIDSEID